MYSRTPQTGDGGLAKLGSIVKPNAPKQPGPPSPVDVPGLPLTLLLTVAFLLLSTPGLGADDRAVPANLAPNPGFEVADGDRPAFWEQRTPSDSERGLRWDGAVARTGARSLRVVNQRSAISRWRTGHLGDLVLQPGSTCELSGWVKTADVKGCARLRLYCIDAKGGITAQPGSGTITGTRDWTQAKLPHRVPPHTAYVMLYAEMEGTGTAWFDDLTLTGTPGEAPERLRANDRVVAPSGWRIEHGFRLGTRAGKRVIELSAPEPVGVASLVFWGETARYDLIVSCFDENDGESEVRLFLNDRDVGRIRLDQNPRGSKQESRLVQRAVPGLDVQRLSRVRLEAQASDGEFCRIHQVTFRPVARFGGEFLPAEALRPPSTLFLAPDPIERTRLQRALRIRVEEGRQRLATDREDELTRAVTPEQWRAYQQRVRARLPEFFGDYGPKCPLNPQVTGRIERPGYVIEKLVFESQPRYFCTANVYVPRGRPFPAPGVLFTCGHASDGKAYHLYHECCLGLVLKGYVVLALDPMGQGERSEYVDPDSGNDRVPRCVPQHHYLGRPSWLVGRCLSGYRTWDCIRAVDYLVTRPEVDTDKIAAVGNSGGGQMALLIAAADERVAVCVAAHPGGSQENTYLPGMGPIDREVLSLIPPRPCLFVAGRDSGEVPGHRRRLADMHRFYDGLGSERERGGFAVVDGVHDMKKPKREAVYAWLNHWFEKEQEGDAEADLDPETVGDLHCTPTGLVSTSLGGESGQSLNAKVADVLDAGRPGPPRSAAELAGTLATLRQRLARRIGWELQSEGPKPDVVEHGTFESRDFVARKLLFSSEANVTLPALLLKPRQDNGSGSAPIVVHVNHFGKPRDDTGPSLALALVQVGLTVLSVDVRGAGETDPRMEHGLLSVRQYDSTQWRVDSAAIGTAYAGTTALALRAFDTIRAVDVAQSDPDLRDRPVVLVGEGLGGVWALVAAAFDPRPKAVCCVGMLPSYTPLVRTRYYAARDYFWVAGALSDYDIGELPALLLPKPVLLLDSVDAMLAPISEEDTRRHARWSEAAFRVAGCPDRFQTVRTSHEAPPGPAPQATAIAQFVAGLEP